MKCADVKGGAAADRGPLQVLSRGAAVLGCLRVRGGLREGGVGVPMGLQGGSYGQHQSPEVTSRRHVFSRNSGWR